MVKARVEGGLVFGLTAALFGEITMKAARRSRAISISTR